MFEWDVAKDLKNQKKHKITFNEAARIATNHERKQYENE